MEKFLQEKLGNLHVFHHLVPRGGKGDLDQNPPMVSAIFQVIGMFWPGVPAQ